MAGKNVFCVMLNRFAVLFVLLLLVGAVLTGQSNQDVVKATVEQFIKDFELNKLAAEKKYIGNIVELAGTIKSIEKSLILGRLRVTFAKGKIAGIVVSDIDCYFPDSARDDLEALQAGKKVTIRGLCKNADTLQDCEVVKK
jgi:hypothetical protein